MSSLQNDTKLFWDYYADLSKNPEKLERGALLDVVVRTFKALEEGKGTLQLGERKIEVAHLKRHNLESFVHFSRQFFKAVELDEKSAFPLVEGMEEVEKNLEAKARSEKGSWLERAEARGALKEIRSAKNEILLHMKVEKSGLERLDKVMELQKEKALQCKEELSKAQKKGRHKSVIAGVVMGAGGALALSGILAALLLVAPWFLLAMGGGLVVFGVGYGFSNRLDIECSSVLSAPRSNLNDAVATFSQLEKFKQNLSKEEFKRFLDEKANGFEKVPGDPKLFAKFFSLYKAEMAFRAAHAELKKKQGEEAGSLLFVKEINEVKALLDRANRLRIELKLEPIEA